MNYTLNVNVSMNVFKFQKVKEKVSIARFDRKFLRNPYVIRFEQLSNISAFTGQKGSRKMDTWR